MAIDNLNYYSSWLPAWQLTDKYSSNPWCLKSKNLDIFSSSKSVKATAFSAPVSWDAWVIAKDWVLELRTDGKVYENWELFIDPNANFPVYPVSYNWKNGDFSDAQWGTPTDMTVAYEWNERKSFVVFTDRASFTYSKVKYAPAKSWTFTNLWYFDNYEQMAGNDNSYRLVQKTVSSSASIRLYVDNAPFTKVPIRIKAVQYNWSGTDISIRYIRMRYQTWYYYDGELDAMTPTGSLNLVDLPFTWNIYDGIDIELPVFPTDWTRICDIEFLFTKTTWNTFQWDGEIHVWVNNLSNDPRNSRDPDFIEWDYNEYYSYLPVRDRKLQPVWEYQWMKGTSFQTLYQWESSWVDVAWEKKTRYDFVHYMWWANDPWMDVVWMTTWNEQVYMIGNKDWNWYIIPCDLSWGRWTPFIAYWCVFKWVVNIDYLLYLVWEYRGISNLWVFNWQELVSILWGNKESWTTDLVWVDEQYNFDWKMVDYRKNLILTTSDNRIFQYWQTYWGKGWTFIHELPSNAVITDLKAVWNNLEIDYSITVNDTTTNYSITYQDDIAKKNYNTEWSATYPIVLGNHLLEKEESDLYASYILPSSDTSLEFWWMANHYHFWTFISEDDVTLDESMDYKLKWATWDYALKFIERNDNQYTFRLEWDLPVQTTNEMKIIDSNNTEVLSYSSFNHSRRIWVIETDKYLEWEFRFTNLNNKLELPKSHSLQIMVKGKGTANYTPELFALDLVANQRDRW